MVLYFVKENLKLKFVTFQCSFVVEILAIAFYFTSLVAVEFDQVWRFAFATQSLDHLDILWPVHEETSKQLQFLVLSWLEQATFYDLILLVFLIGELLIVVAHVSFLIKEYIKF